MKKRLFCLSIIMIVVAFFFSGCATGPKSIPSAYFQKDYEMSVEVSRCPEKPQMMDKGGGPGVFGLVGLVVNAARASEMREKMEGIKGDAFKELLRQKISEKMEDYFEIVDENPNLVAEIEILQWGWFVPTTMMGIKTGSYQFRINGKVHIYEQKKDERVLIGNASALTQQSMGNDPTKDVTQEAMLKAIEDFSDKVMKIILAEAS